MKTRIMKKIIKPIKINRSNFAAYGDLITTEDVNSMDINEGYAKRFDNLANLDYGEGVKGETKT